MTLQDESILNPDQPLEGTRWVVTSTIANQGVSSVPESAQASLVFDATSVAVETGCNSGSGGYEVQDDVITFGPIATTMKMCVDEGIAALEQSVLAVLQGEVQYGDRRQHADAHQGRHRPRPHRGRLTLPTPRAGTP